MKNKFAPYAESLNPNSAKDMDKYNERYHAFCSQVGIVSDEIVEWVTRDQARQYMGVFPHTLATLIYRGRIRLHSKKNLVLLDDVICYMMKKMAEL